VSAAALFYAFVGKLFTLPPPGFQPATYHESGIHYFSPVAHYSN
jgi:hypothetical protein